jgi:hypothetical protein
MFEITFIYCMQKENNGPQIKQHLVSNRTKMYEQQDGLWCMRSCYSICRFMCTHCISLFVPFRLAIVLSVLLRFTDSDYPFGIFKLIKDHIVTLRCCSYILVRFDTKCCFICGPLFSFCMQYMNVISNICLSRPF